MAERQGFEPWIPCGIHAFQACAFSHSAISPQINDLRDRLSEREHAWEGHRMDRFTESTRERRCLHNVSPATVSWYTHALRWLPSETSTQAELKDSVLRMRE